MKVICNEVRSTIDKMDHMIDILGMKLRNQ
jgi:hypothetical protein